MDDQQQQNSQPSNEELELKEYRNENGEFDIAKLKQLDSDKKYYRQQISKLKQLPADKEEYSKDFVLDSKFDEYMSDEKNKERVTDIFNKIDDMSMEKGIGIERNHDIRRFVLDELVSAGTIDITSQAERKAREAKIIDERNTKVKEYIGDATDMDGWNTQLKGWLRSFCNNEAEYAMHEKLIDTNATWALSLNKVRQALSGNRIPMIDGEPNYSPEEWQRAFVKADTETQNKMLEERARKLTKGK